MRKSYHELDDKDLARICHEAHLALRIGLNDSADDMHFDALPQERKDVVINQVKMFREGARVQDVHRAWVEWMLARGWVRGEIRDREKKTHPNLVPYVVLPEEEKAKVRQAQRIVFTHVMPEALEEIAYSDIRSRSVLDELTRLGEEIGSLAVVVCTTHMRFIPCRKDDGTCMYSEDQADIDRVYRYHNEQE